MGQQQRLVDAVRAAGQQLQRAAAAGRLAKQPVWLAASCRACRWADWAWVTRVTSEPRPFA
jgi:hypothetical protein